MELVRRFVDLTYVANNLAQVFEQSAQEIMILTNGFNHPIAAITFGNDLEEIREIATDLHRIGQSPGLGRFPYFIPFGELRSALRHCQCQLNRGNSVIVQIERLGDNLHLMGLIPITLGAQLSLMGERAVTSRQQLPASEEA